MKPLVLFTILNILTLNCISQVVEIQFLEFKTPITGVSVMDSVQKIILISDENGKVYLNMNDYDLSVTHVSYNSLRVKLLSKDSSPKIRIQLQKKITELKEIIVSDNSYYKKNKTFFLGRFSKNALSGIHYFSQGKLGAVVEYDSMQIPVFLETIKFQLRNIDATKRLDSKLEIKLYRIIDDYIDLEPINNLPIIIDFKDLKKNNAINIKEKLKLPQGKVLVSFEFFNTNSKNNNCDLFFVGKENSENCLTIRNSIFSSNWQGVRIPKNCSFNHETNKNLRLNLSLKCNSYYEKNN